MKIFQALTVALALSAAAAAAPAADPTANPAARFYPLAGTWTGTGQISENGQAPAKLAMSWNCRTASASYGMLCEMKAHNNQMKMAETDLFGVDPVTGKGHWFSVTNTGETHDHIADWTDAKTMKARYAWNQDGKKMEENVTVKLNGARHVEFHTVVTADGKEVTVFKGALQR